MVAGVSSGSGTTGPAGSHGFTQGAGVGGQVTTQGAGVGGGHGIGQGRTHGAGVGHGWTQGVVHGEQQREKVGIFGILFHSIDFLACLAAMKLFFMSAMRPKNAALSKDGS